MHGRVHRILVWPAYEYLIGQFAAGAGKKAGESRRVEMEEIEKNDFNLNISRYISTAAGEEEIDLGKTHQSLVDIEKDMAKALKTHNGFLRELGLPLLPMHESK